MSNLTPEAQALLLSKGNGATTLQQKVATAKKRGVPARIIPLPEARAHEGRQTINQGYKDIKTAVTSKALTPQALALIARKKKLGL